MHAVTVATSGASGSATRRTIDAAAAANGTKMENRRGRQFPTFNFRFPNGARNKN